MDSYAKVIYEYFSGGNSNFYVSYVYMQLLRY